MQLFGRFDTAVVELVEATIIPMDVDAVCLSTLQVAEAVRVTGAIPLILLAHRGPQALRGEGGAWRGETTPLPVGHTHTVGPP